MSTFGGPNIIKNDLILSLDAGSTRSFRGEPTSNLISNPIFNGNIGGTPINWSSGGTSSIRRITQSKLFPSHNAWECEVILNNNTGFISQTLPTLTSGQTYTVSIWVEEFNYIGGNFPIVSIFNTTISSGFRSIGRTTISNEQPSITTNNLIVNERIDFTFVVSSTTTNAIIRVGTPHTSSGGYLRVSKIQIEQKPYPTPFVNGTRGTTVASGGGWADLSGNSNNGELINGPIFNSNNLGSIQFDGVDDYIETIKSTTEISFTVSGWIFYNGNVTTQQPVVSKWFSGGLSWMLDTVGTNIIRWLIRGSSGGDVIISSTILPNSWMYFTATYQTGTGNCNLYINSNLVGNGVGRSSLLEPTNRVQIGRKGDSSSVWFNGNISNIKIYNRVLTPEEILQNYNATKGRYGL
jgi:hypothetical protein